MSQRNYYVTDDGTAHLDDARGTARRAYAKLVPRDDLLVLAKCMPQCHDGPSALPPAIFVAAADRESGLASNEVDVEPPKDKPTGFTSRGLFQISSGEHFDGGAYYPSEDELMEVGLDRRAWDLLDVAHSVGAFAMMMARRRGAIVVAAKLQRDVAPPGDLWFYLAISHNEGLAAALRTIAAHGMRADGPGGYKERNGCCGLHTSARDNWDHACSGGTCTDYGKRIGRYGDAYRVAAIDG